MELKKRSKQIYLFLFFIDLKGEKMEEILSKKEVRENLEMAHEALSIANRILIKLYEWVENAED